MTNENPVNILIVEDSPTQAMKLKMVLEDQDYAVISSASGKEGLEAAKANKPNLIISDIEMPEMNGYEMCEAIKNMDDLKNIPVILLTSLSDPEDIIKGLNAKADSYVTKPYNSYFLLSKIAYLLSNPIVQRDDIQDEQVEFEYKNKHHVIKTAPQKMLNLMLSTYEDSVLRNYELQKTQEALEDLTKKLEDKVAKRTSDLESEVTEKNKTEADLVKIVKRLQGAMESIISAIAATLEIRDPYTALHQKRVCQLACAIAEEMNLPKKLVRGVRMAATIHDIGKISIPMEVMNKPGKLSELEYDQIKKHPQVGFDILKSVEFPWPIAQIVLQHHERLDGSGYPKGLLDEEILPESRVLSVADVVEAMASHRPYRPALGLDAAMEEITAQKMKLYDPMVVDACVKLIKEKKFKFDDN